MDERKRFLVAIVCVIVLVCALGSIVYRRLHRPQFDDGTATYQGMGEVVAEASSKIAVGEGKVVLVTDPGTSGKNTIAQAVQRGSGGKISPVARTSNQPMDGDGLAEFAQQNGAGTVVVFEGSIDLQKLRTEGKPNAGLVLVTGDWGTAKELLQKKIIRAAIVPRTNYPAEGMPIARTPRERFENGYEVITAENADSLPALR